MRNYARWILVAVVVLGLAYGAYSHFDLAGTYEPIKNSSDSLINQGLLFRIEAALAVVAAVAVLARPNVRTAAAAFAVAGGGAAALTLYRYVDVGKIGPLPDMYEPVWYSEKTNSLIAMIVAAVAAVALAAVELQRRSVRS